MNEVPSNISFGEPDPGGGGEWEGTVHQTRPDSEAS